MVLFGQIIVYIIMACALAGCLAYIFKEGSELGNQFLEGIYAIGAIFIPVAGVMASAPYLTALVKVIFGPAFQAIGADPSMAATTFIAVDMGGYQLADALAATRESWIMAEITGYMAGATIVYNIPVALKMLNKKDRPYLALGMMSGFLMIPVGVLISSVIIALTNPMIRETVATSGDGTYQLALSFMLIFKNLIPLIIICVAIAIGLMIIPDKMIKGFAVFGKVMDCALTLILTLCIIEYFTGIFSKIFGAWGFEPILADAADCNRALEIAGYIGIMLCGAFPMVYLLTKYLSKPLEAIGKVCGLSKDAVAGILAGAANAIALYKLIGDMKAEDKVKCLAFAVCSAFLIGDHLSFTANFQPTLILPVMAGKLIAGCLSVYIATKIAVPKARQIEALQAKEDSTAA
ncbi:ethanolamine utilization protein EutH [Aminipila sp.]|uniref:ethanolamine utilization protein EutH n=1 Tax=Aminipila sp. TaxID=2060095 RepID=UPI00289CF324|nr:ethanolamine utilization protein EutH [Aminipila sp.]